MIMSANIKKKSQRMTGQSMPGTQNSSRADVYIKEEVDEEAIKEESKRMDEMMRRLMGGDDDEESESAEESEDMEEVKQEEEEEAFSFRLFASQPVATVKIVDEVDNTNDWARAVADQQVYEFDETDPEFVVRAKAAAIDYETILKQSSVPYPALRQARRVVHVTASGDIVKKETCEKKKVKRKSKKCRDFEKAVKEGKIVLKPNMRNPNTPDGWPGWPGNLTRVAIVDYDSGKKKRGNNNSRGDGFKARGDSRGGRGGMMGRGRGRGRSF